MKSCMRMAREKIVLFAHQRFPAWIFFRRTGAAGMRLQLEPAFVVLIHGLEERPWLGGVDQHRNLQPGAGFKHFVEARIIHMDALAFGVLQIHAEVFEDLQTLRAVLHIAVELRGGALRCIRDRRCW